MPDVMQPDTSDATSAGLSGAPPPGAGSLPNASQLQSTPPIAPDPSQQHRGILSDILHAVGDVLGGPTTKSVVNQQTGAIEKVPLSRGERIAHGIATGIIGAAAGAAQHGPGAAGKAGLAGAQAEQQVQQRTFENQQEESKNIQGQNEAKQRALLNQATIAHMSQQTAALSWQMAREGTEIDEKTADKVNAMRQLIATNPQAKSYGEYPSFADFLKSHGELKEDGVDLAQLQARGELIPIPVTKDGKVTGVEVFHAPPSIGEQLNDKPFTLQHPTVGKDGKVTTTPQTIPAGGMKQVDLWKMAGNDVLEGLKAQQESVREQAETQVTPKERFIQAQETARAVLAKQTQMAVSANKQDFEDIDNLSSKGKDSYANFAAENNGFAADLAAAQSGDQLASSFAKTMGIQNVNKLADMTRISPSEYEAVGPGLGSLYRQMATAITKAGSGKPAPDTLKELLALQQRVQQAKYSAYISGVHAKVLNNKGKGGSMDPKDVNVMTPDGVHTVTLDKALQSQGPPVGEPHQVVVNGQVVGVTTDGGKTMTPVSQ